jgi:hypothetical protein
MRVRDVDGPAADPQPLEPSRRLVLKGIRRGGDVRPRPLVAIHAGVERCRPKDSQLLVVHIRARFEV